MSEYNINPIFDDSEIYKMWVEHYNLMDKMSEHKKWEWEDEELTGNYNITDDFDEWLLFNEEDSTPEDYKNILNECISELKDLVDGYVLGCTGMYEGKGFYCESYKAENVTEIIEHMKQVRDSYEKVFLYAMINHQGYLPNESDRKNIFTVRYHGVKS